MTRRALTITAGRIARQQLAEQGWSPDLFSLLLGASGGPKWLVLSQLDRVLLGDFLQGRTKPLPVLGTSIGSWRHSCLAQSDTIAATERMEEHYIHQSYTEKPDIAEITEVSKAILKKVLGDTGAKEIAENQLFQTHIGTVRGRGLLAARHPWLQGAGLTLAALSNMLHRSLLQPHYQRVVFSHGGDTSSTGMLYKDFFTTTVALTEENVEAALLSSGSIPLVLDGVETPTGAPKGTYWDGGIVDYHHDLRAYKGEGIILYPHFYSHIIPGWFDKMFKGRRPGADLLERVILIAPSEDFVASLPDSKIPDRKDFQRFDNETRIQQWKQVVAQCEVLAEEMQQVLAQSDPLEGVQSF